MCYGQVRFGDKAGGRMSKSVTVRGSIVCAVGGSAGFEDPAVGEVKKCYCTPDHGTATKGIALQQC